MYCPRCGQQQISNEMRFCSRCGLSMSELAEWLAGGGAPALRAAETQVSLPSPRRKGIRRGAKLMFLSAVLFPVFLAISLIGDEGAPMIVPVLLFFVSLVMMLYSRLFGDPTTPVQGHPIQTPGLAAMSQHSALPPASNLPMHGASNIGRQSVRTNELAHPPSVTENTTKLLDTE
jgi:endogenous inhibitor of DNA gyrase (YacG/DUF329 family)